MACKESLHAQILKYIWPLQSVIFPIKLCRKNVSWSENSDLWPPPKKLCPYDATARSASIRFLLPSFSYPGYQSLKIFLSENLSWVVEPQNLKERKLVSGKERERKGVFLSFLIVSFYHFLALGTQGTENSVHLLSLFLRFRLVISRESAQLYID